MRDVAFETQFRSGRSGQTGLAFEQKDEYVVAREEDPRKKEEKVTDKGMLRRETGGEGEKER